MASWLTLKSFNSHTILNRIIFKKYCRKFIKVHNTQQTKRKIELANSKLILTISKAELNYVVVSIMINIYI